ncbi:MAG: dihydrofolate reductase [Pseudomonadota bacterium]|nr:dihydrofolate reductase [Pseudomonadota bacterium]
MSWQGLEVVHVVAMDRQRCIGVNNQLPWHLSDDLKHFKTTTQGGVMLLGRKNFDSIGRPLPNRTSWVLTRDSNWHAAGVQVAHSLAQLLDSAAADAKAQGLTRMFVIGGAELYRQTLDIADRLEISHVDLQVAGDVFYPPIPDDFKVIQRNHMTDSKTATSFEIVRYQRH